MSTGVPELPNTIETSPDLVLEKVRAANPPSAEEIAAERALQAAEAAYADLQRRIGKSLVDIGAREGSVFGFALQPHSFDREVEELHLDLDRALVKFNRLKQARHWKIQREVDIENAKEAAAAQRAWQRARGIEAAKA